MKAFELYLQSERITGNDWQRLIEEIREFEKRFIIEVVFDFNTVRFFVYSQKNIALLTTKLQGFFLKPVDKKLIKKGDRFIKRVRFKLPSNKSIAEFQEIENIKRQRKINKIIISCSEIFFVKFYKVEIFLKNDKDHLFYSVYATLANPLVNLEFDFGKNVRLKRKSAPLFLKLEEVARLFSSGKQEGFLEVDGFPYFSSPLYLSLKNLELNKHTLIVGQTGVGKSKLIELVVKQIAQLGLAEEYRVIVIDPHAVLYPQFLTLREKINLDFIRSSCNLFPAFSEPKIATELTILLFKTLLQDQFNAKLERILKYVIYVLFIENQMSLLNLKKFLTELEFRKEIFLKIGDRYDYLVHFFETDFVEMQTKYYEIAIMPILVLIDELNFIPAFSRESASNLESILKNNFLTCFSLNRIFLGEKATRLIAGLIIQQLFLIAQTRSINKKIILIIDEVSLVENEAMISILSEARKFDLSLFLSQQYLTQISPDLLKAILSNVYNYFIFKVSDEDAKILVKSLQVKFPDEILIKEKSKGLSEDDLKRELLVSLNPRECLVRVFYQQKFFPCFKGKTIGI